MFKSWLLFLWILALHTLVLGQILQHTLPLVKRVPVKPVMVNLITLPPPPVVKFSPPLKRPVPAVVPLSPEVKPADKPKSIVAVSPSNSHSKQEQVTKKRPRVAVNEVKAITAVNKAAPLKQVKEILSPQVAMSPSKKLEKILPTSEKPVVPSVKVNKESSDPVLHHSRNTSSTFVQKRVTPPLPTLQGGVTASPPTKVTAVSKDVGEATEVTLEKEGNGSTSLGSTLKKLTPVPPASGPRGNPVSKAVGVGKGEVSQAVKKEPGSITVAPSYGAAYLQNPGPAYPALSLRRGEEGKVWLRVQVTPAGGVAKVQIKVSSGYQRLDEAARETVSQWRFVPAKKDGVPVSDWVVVPVVFKLNEW
jgi:TonB family protein